MNSLSYQKYLRRAVPPLLPEVRRAAVHQAAGVLRVEAVREAVGKRFIPSS